jgi:hypothetical protein
MYYLNSQLSLKCGEVTEKKVNSPTLFWQLLLSSVSRLAQAAMLPAHVWEVPGLNLGWDSSCPG